MSTRAVVSVRDQYDSYHIYTHCDGYPSSQKHRFKDTLEYAWELPRFEAADWAAAFVRANKEHGGNIYFTNHWEDHTDIDYRYVVWFEHGKLFVDIYDRSGSWNFINFRGIYSGPLLEFDDDVGTEEDEG